MRIEFKLEKETKGAVRFSEVTASKLDEPIVGTLYVRKSGLKKMGWTTIPNELALTFDTKMAR